jgi:hypothetical protein
MRTILSVLLLVSVYLLVAMGPAIVTMCANYLIDPSTIWVCIAEGWPGRLLSCDQVFTVHVRPALSIVRLQRVIINGAELPSSEGGFVVAFCDNIFISHICFSYAIVWCR